MTAKSTTTPSTDALTAFLSSASTGLKRCECHIYGTGCTSSTARTFAPGHDAKLKSLLLRAMRADLLVPVTFEGQTHQTDPLKVAAKYGFGLQVLQAKERMLADERAKAEPQADPAPSKAKV